MSRLIFKDAKTLLAPFVTYSGDPQAATVTATAINFVIANFMESDLWKGIREQMFIAVYDNHITTPEGIETVDKVIMIEPQYANNVSSENVNIQPEWYEYSENGLGLFPTNYTGDTQAIRQGGGFCVFRDPPSGGSTFTITKEATSESGQMIVKALDNQGNPIWNAGQEGILINLATQLPFTSADVVTGIYEVSKPQTNGRIFLKYTSPSTTSAGIYGPNETTPDYQRYKIVGRFPETRSCLALVERGFVMLKNDYDLVIPSSLNALRYGVQAYIYDQQNDLERAKVYWGKAYESLDRELSKFQGMFTRRQIDVDMKAFALGGPNNGIQNLI